MPKLTGYEFSRAMTWKHIKVGLQIIGDQSQGSCASLQGRRESMAGTSLAFS